MRLGYANVDRMLAGMTSEQLSEWVAYSNIEPFDDGYWQAGLVASVFANVMGAGKRKLTPHDFMPIRRSDDATPQEQPAAVGISIMRLAMARQNAKAADEQGA